jgi:hypothetical protein
MDYLYFPEDRLEYIPGFFWLVVVFVIAVVAIRIFKRISEKELKKAKLVEQKLMEHKKQSNKS